MASTGSAITRAPRPSSLADVLDLILDKGLVIDAYIRISAVGIELLTIDARIVVASVDTYLHYAEAVNRLDLSQTETQGITGLFGNDSDEQSSSSNGNAKSEANGSSRPDGRRGQGRSEDRRLPAGRSGSDEASDDGGARQLVRRLGEKGKRN